jgi:hypothetical protein
MDGSDLHSRHMRLGRGVNMHKTTRFRFSTVTATAALLMLLILGSAGIALAITNGQPDGNAHPYVGLVVFDVGGGPAWRTTGILISPTIVVTAGHGTDGADAARVWFDTDLTGNTEYPFGGSTSTEGTPYTHPDFCIGCGKGLPAWDTHDVGVVVLDEPVYLSEYAELATEDMVVRGGGRPYWQGDLIRQFAPSKLIASKHKHGDEFIKLTANPAQGKGGATFGDSGGPVLINGTNTAIAINSYITNYNAAGVTYAHRLDTASVLEWIASF